MKTSHTAALLVWSAVSAVTFGNDSPGHILHEARQVDDSAWVKHAPLDANSLVPLRIGLKHSNLDKGEELLLEL